MIAQDGTVYIESAKQIANNPIEAVQSMQPCPGYPFLIYLAHRASCFFNDTESIQGWIFSAQTVSLLSKVIASIALYFVGSYIVGRRTSFWGVLILTVLPDSVEFGSDVLTEWPHMMFLTVGFLLLLLAVQNHKIWIFGLAGVISGLGYLVRSEGCQLILYGSIWLAFDLIKTQNQMKRTKAIGALILLLTGFAIVAIPYMQLKGYVFPDQKMWKLLSYSSFGNDIYHHVINTNLCLAGLSINQVIRSCTLITNICETLVYYFFPALLVGVYCFRKQAKTQEQTFFATAFVILNVALLCWQSDRFLSQRHTFALVSFTIFYIPLGLHKISDWLISKKLKDNHSIEKSKREWFFILMIIGFGICAAKFARISPIRWEKQGYKEIANWLRENTKPDDVIAVPDNRITFYAERNNTSTLENEICQDVQYIVKLTTSPKTSLEGPLLFNGMNTVVKTNLTMTGESSITVSALVKSNADLADGTIFSPSAWYNDFFFIRSINNRWYVCLRWGTNTSYYLVSKNSYMAGEWYQITGVADIPNQRLYLYVNGTLSNSLSIDSKGVFDNEFKWNIGGTSTQYFNGSIANIMICNKALEKHEVEALYAGRTRMTNLSDVAQIICNTSLLAYWRIDEKSSTWIEEMDETKEAVYEALADPRKKMGKKIVVYKK